MTLSNLENFEILTLIKKLHLTIDYKKANNGYRIYLLGQKQEKLNSSAYISTQQLKSLEAMSFNHKTMTKIRGALEEVLSNHAGYRVASEILTKNELV
jgi:hypothetical protein